MDPVHLDVCHFFLWTLSSAAHIAAELSASACSRRHCNSRQTILEIHSDQIHERFDKERVFVYR